MSRKKDIIKWVIAEYPFVQQSAVYGLMEFAETANRLAPAGTPKLEVSSCVLSERNARHKSDFDVVILPPCLSESPPGFGDSTQSQDWLKKCHRNGALICSVCSGTFLLAETGLLDGRSATTHWLYSNSFSEKFPQVELQLDRLIDHHDDVMTAGGSMAWTDLALHLIEHFHGTETMLEVSHLYLVEPGQRQQKQYAAFVPKRNHGDDKILATQMLVEEKLMIRWSIVSLAQQVGLTERTFIRRFKRATDLTPTQYQQQLRVAAARRELEATNLSIEQVANIVGYADTPAFSRIFKKLVGLTPGVYRDRFAASD